MSALRVSAVVCAVAGFAATAAASAIPVANNPVADRPAIINANGLVPLDLTGTSIGGSLTTPNSYAETFIAAGGNFSGSLSVEVFGNVGTPGVNLNDVVLVYTFVGDAALNGVESFHFGINSSLDVDVTDLASPNALQGVIDADTTAGQTAPEVTLFDNALANDTWLFDFGATSDDLGGASGEALTWYVRTGGDIKLNFTDVLILDFGGVSIQMLAPVVNPNQPDLNLPAPGAAALCALAGAFAARRRRG